MAPPNNTKTQKLAYHLAEWLIDNKYFRNCLNCNYWDHEKEMCKTYNLRPPAKVIIVGCETHSDEIPF